MGKAKGKRRKRKENIGKVKIAIGLTCENNRKSKEKPQAKTGKAYEKQIKPQEKQRKTIEKAEEQRRKSEEKPELQT